MRSSIVLPTLAVAAALLGLPAHAAPPYLAFDGGIGVDPLTAAGGADVLNTVRGIAPGGRAWVIRRLRASVSADATVVASGSGLLLSSGEGIATRGPVTHVAASLACGPASAAATVFTSEPFPLGAAGNFTIAGPLSADGVNTAVLPATCDNPVLLIRAANPVTKAAGGWFAAAIPVTED